MDTLAAGLAIAAAAAAETVVDGFPLPGAEAEGGEIASLSGVRPSQAAVLCCCAVCVCVWRSSSCRCAAVPLSPASASTTTRPRARLWRPPSP